MPAREGRNHDGLSGAPTVVVGVKGTGRFRDAIRLAAREASYRGASLLAIMAYSADHSLGASAGRPLAVMHSAGPGEAARKLDADLIVVASRGSAMIAGTVSQYLLRRALCSVPVVPAADGGTSM